MSDKFRGFFRQQLTNEQRRAKLDTARGGREERLRHIREKNLTVGDQVTDGKFTGELSRIDEEGNAWMKRGSSEQSYNPAFLDKVSKRKGVEK
ncbi:hypothetical protein HY413_02210 [Candidatus Kaiserbacteria bacterium]|nr:hypothetical protein [Candidatus Kaiserbacteria bacterium]